MKEKRIEDQIEELNERLCINGLHEYRVRYFYELDKALANYSTEDIFNLCFYGKYHPRDKFFHFDHRGNIVTLSGREVYGYILVAWRMVEEAEKWGA